jgi:hypothetical protein
MSSGRPRENRGTPAPGRDNVSVTEWAGAGSRLAGSFLLAMTTFQAFSPHLRNAGTFRHVLAIGLLLGVSLTGCGKSTTPTSPTTTTATEDPEVAIVTESFAGTLPVGGARFYSFEVSASGTAELTLEQVGGNSAVPPTVWVGLGLGIPDGTDCSTTTSLNTQAGATPQVSSVVNPGTFCARVYDIGNLAAPAAFLVTIAHP